MMLLTLKLKIGKENGDIKLRLVPLTKKECRYINEILSLKYNFAVSKRETLYRVTHNEIEILIVKGQPLFFQKSKNQGYVPTLIAIIKGFVKLPKVIVDEGAITPLLRGADVMIPGIKEYEEFNVGDYVAIQEIKNKSYIAIGKALINSVELKKKSKGKAIENVHRAGDVIWRLCLEIIKKYSRRLFRD